MNAKLILPLAGALLGLITSAWAQEKALTMDQAVQSALERNLNVVQAQNNVASAQSRVLASQGSYLPTLSASGSWTRTQNDSHGESPVVLPSGQVLPGASGFSVNSYFSTGLNLDYTLFDGFRREATLNSASSSAVATEQLSSRTRQSIVYQTQSAYINALRNEQLVKVSEENLKRDYRQLERITESNRVGALSLADVYRQQSQVATDELSVINAQNNYDKAKADLISLIGLEVNENYALVDPGLAPEALESELSAAPDPNRNFSSVAAKALASRPDYMSATENLDAAESGVTAARSGYFPRVSAFAGYGISNTEFSRISDNKNLRWGISIGWNIFDGFQTNESIQSAIVSRRNAEVALKQAERNINVEVKKALLDLDAARKAYDVSQKGLVSATQDRKIAEERYNLGAGTLLDLLTANAGLVNAQANKVNASYDFIIANRNVEYATGERTY